MKLDEKLVFLRKEKGITQLELAEALKVSRQAVSKWESGASLPSTENLRSLSELYGVSVDYLLNEGEKEQRKTGFLPEESRDVSGISCKGKRDIAIKWILATLILLILVVFIRVIFADKNKEDLIWIDEMKGEEVEIDRVDRSFSLEW